MKNIALAVCNLYKEHNPCDEILAKALVDSNFNVKIEVWDDPDTKWENYDLVILRSACDYIDNVDKFLEWISDVSSKTKLVNEEAIKNNCNKIYLKKLEGKGIPIVPTKVADSLSDLIAEVNNSVYDDLVIKHSLGAKGLRTFHFKKNQLDQIYQTISEIPINKKTPMLVQPFLNDVKECGEISVMFFGGDYSFAVNRKQIKDEATLSSQDEEEVLYIPTKEEIDFCYKVLSIYEFIPDYARIDFIVSEGQPLLVKTGFIEPNLYFHISPTHVNDFIKVIKKHLD